MKHLYHMALMMLFLLSFPTTMTIQNKLKFSNASKKADNFFNLDQILNCKAGDIACLLKSSHPTTNEDRNQVKQAEQNKLVRKEKDNFKNLSPTGKKALH